MTLPTLGVIVVTFNSSDVILDCLESLLAQQGVGLTIVVVDNDSTDGTPDLVRDWAAGRVVYTPAADMPFPLAPAAKPLALGGDDSREGGAAVRLVETGVNGGFAAGVNCGLAHLARLPGITRFWVLNPDGVAAPGAAAAFASYIPPEGGKFSLMGGRVTYLETPDRIQIDGGTINWKSGVTGNLNLGCSFANTPAPKAMQLDFVTGASMVASREFYERAGPMAEDYFLYYEEVDWALRRGDLPLALCPEARVYHRGGTSIGSPTLDRIASPFSIYFKQRGRMRFMRRHRRQAMLTAWGWSLAKAAQMVLRGYRAEAVALLAGAWDAAPPDEVRARLSFEAAQLAFAAAR